MLDMPSKVLLINLPTHNTSTITKLPEYAEKEGAMYFVTTDEGVPFGIALSDKDKKIAFYSVMQEQTADAVRLEEIEGIEAENVQEALEFLTGLVKNVQGKAETANRILYERTLSGVL